MIDDHNPSEPFADRLGAAFDDAAHRERHRMDRRAAVQRAALWVAVIALPIAALSLSNGSNDSSNDAADEVPAPTSLPLITETTATSSTTVGSDESTAQLIEVSPTSTTLEPAEDQPVDEPQAASTSAPPLPPSTAPAANPPTTTLGSTAIAPTTSSEPKACAPATVLEIGDLGDGSSSRLWGDAAVISGYDAAGAPADISAKNNVIAVAGGRYGFQVDFDPDAGSSERIDVHFTSAPCSVELTLAMFEVGEYANESGAAVDESGRWTAFSVNGTEIASGNFSAGGLPADGQDRLLALSFATPVDMLRIEAVGYGAGAHPAAGPNNSDFSIRRMAIS